MSWYTTKGSMGQGLVIDEADGRNVAVAYDDKDALLIAAAPELLEVCKLVLAQHDTTDCLGPTVAADVRAAVQKATGTSG